MKIKQKTKQRLFFGETCFAEKLTERKRSAQQIKIKPMKKFYKTYIKKHEMSTFSLD
jgi:hypothetical protein